MQKLSNRRLFFCKGPEYSCSGFMQLKRKQDAKYDHELEEDLREWIQEILGTTLDADFQKALKSGVKLCKYDSVPAVFLGNYR